MPECTVETETRAEINRQIQEAYINLALALRQAGEYEEAAATLRRAIERDPEAPTPYLALGLVLNDAGQYAEAEEALRQALERTTEREAQAAAYAALALLSRG